MEARWEALEELESHVGGGKGRAGQVHLLYETEHIALFRSGALRIIRIGDAGLVEEATWRYGLGPEDGSALGRGRASVQARLPQLPKWLQEKGVVWRGKKNCPACRYEFTELPFLDRKILVVRPTGWVPPGVDAESSDPVSGYGPSPTPTLTRRCPRCRDAEYGGLHLQGLEGELALFRILAFEHHTGAPIDRVRAAARMVQDPDGPATLIRILTQHGRPLGDIPPVGVLALEIVTNAAREDTLLKLELAELTFRWRQEEELAALVDGELTPAPRSLWEGLLRKLRG